MSKYSNFLKLLNIQLISTRVEVLKLDKSKDIKSLHSLNIENIWVTLLVLNLSIPFISINYWQEANIKLISVALEILKLDKSRDII